MDIYFWGVGDGLQARRCFPRKKSFWNTWNFFFLTRYLNDFNTHLKNSKANVFTAFWHKQDLWPTRYCERLSWPGHSHMLYLVWLYLGVRRRSYSPVSEKPRLGCFDGFPVYRGDKWQAEVKPEPGPSEFNSNIPSSAPVGGKGLVSALFYTLKND